MAAKPNSLMLIPVVAMVLGMILFVASPSLASESGFSLNTGYGYKTPPMQMQFRWEVGLDGKEELVQWNGYDFTRKVWLPRLDEVEKDIQGMLDRIRAGIR